MTTKIPKDKLNKALKKVDHGLGLSGATTEQFDYFHGGYKAGFKDGYRQAVRDLEKEKQSK